MSKLTLPRILAFGALTALLGLNACQLDKVTIPPLIGPSELGVSVQMSAQPDLLPADGASVSAIVVVVRDPDGRPLPNRAIFFQLTGVGGTLIGTGGIVGSGLQLVSDSNGTITLFYKAGTTTGLVSVTARLYGVDANATSPPEVIRQVAIQLV
jgi:hypothetical protein